jgi:hypothetical protein
MKPGRRSEPVASMTASWVVEGSAPTDSIRPSRTETDPVTTSIRSFIVRMVA